MANDTAAGAQPRRIFLATPSQDGVTPHWVASLFNLLRGDGPERIQLEFGINTTGSIAISRDILARMARDMGCDGIVFCDTDMKWSPADFYRIIGHGKPIVGASYARKQVDLRWVSTGLPGETPDAESGLMKVREIGTGFLYVAMEVFDRMAAELPQIEYDCPDERGVMRPMWNFFFQGVLKRRFLGEDYGFCALARSLGYDIYADTRCIIPHTGKIDYPLNAMQSLRAQLLAKSIRTVLLSAGDALDNESRTTLVNALADAA